jgi:hypothetical protein
MRKKQPIAHRPAYSNGQLLLADDFIAEQRFHILAGDRHSLNLHGWGVVRGLAVTRVGDSSVNVSAGYAIDGRGREIELRDSEALELQGVQPNALLTLSLGYRTDWPDKDSEPTRSVECYALLRIAAGIEEHDVQLATLQLDDKARLLPAGIGTAGRRSLQVVHKGWLRMPFRPTRIPEDQWKNRSDALPPFRVGATQAVAHKLLNEIPNLKGAGGTMAIVPPPQVTHIHRLRVAGAANDKTVTIVLYKSVWSDKQMALSKHEVVNEIVEGKSGAGAFDKTWTIAPEHMDMDAECSTLSLSIRTTAYAAISLVALEVSY